MGRFIKRIKKNNQESVARSSESSEGASQNECTESNCYMKLDDRHNKLEEDYNQRGIELITIGANFKDLQNEYDTYKDETMNTLEAKAEAQNKELARAFSTHSSKSMYQTEQIASLNWSVYYLLWLYAVVAVIFLVVLFGGPNANKTSIYVKAIVTVLLVLYPFYVTTVENFLYAFFQFGLHIIYGDVYIQSSY